MRDEEGGEEGPGGSWGRSVEQEKRERSEQERDMEGEDKRHRTHEGWKKDRGEEQQRAQSRG